MGSYFTVQVLPLWSKAVCVHREWKIFRHHGWRHFFLGNFKCVETQTAIICKNINSFRKPAIKTLQPVRFWYKNANVPVTITVRASAILTNHGLRHCRCPWHVHAQLGRGGRGHQKVPCPKIASMDRREGQGGGGGGRKRTQLQLWCMSHMGRIFPGHRPQTFIKKSYTAETTLLISPEALNSFIPPLPLSPLWQLPTDNHTQKYDDAKFTG